MSDTVSAKKKKKKWKVPVISVVLFILVLLLGLGIAGLCIYNHYTNLVTDSLEIETIDYSALDSKWGDLSKENDTGIMNILLIGSDGREGYVDKDAGEGERSDIMIVVSIDSKSKMITMTSILRDSWVEFEEGRYDGHDRINMAYQFGGAELLMKTIYQNYGIPIDKVVIVDFYMVADVIDYLGGVDMMLSEEEIYYLNVYYLPELVRIAGLEKGTYQVPETAIDNVYHYNGYQTVAYARIRYVGTDFARTERQRRIITLCLDKVKKMNIMEIGAMAEEFLPRVKMNMSNSDITSLMQKAMYLNEYKTQTLTLPMKDTYDSVKWEINGDTLYVLANIDFQTNYDEWHFMVYGE